MLAEDVTICLIVFQAPATRVTGDMASSMFQTSSDPEGWHSSLVTLRHSKLNAGPSKTRPPRLEGLEKVDI